MKKKSNFILTPVSASFFIFLILIVACSSEKTIDSPAGEITVTENKNGIEVKSRDGSLSIEGNEKKGHISIKTDEGENIEVAYNKNKLPADFPKDIPIYTPSTITMSQVMNKGKTAVATLNTSDDSLKVVRFYKKALPLQGWSVEGEMNMGGMVMLQGKKGNTMLNLSVVKGEDGTNITLAKAEEE